MKKNLLCLLLLLSLCLLPACSEGEKETPKETTETTITPPPAGAVTLTLADGGISSSDPSRASVSGSVLTITAGGEYFLSGSLTDGQIVVAANDTANVTLIFSGVDLKSETGAPVFVKSCKNCYIELAKGTRNSLTDAASYVDQTSEVNAALYSKCDLVIRGKGTLNVNGSFNNAISSKDDLKIEDGVLNIIAKNNGLKGKDSVTIKGGTVAIDALGDAIKSDEEQKADKGFVLIEGGSLKLDAKDEGIQGFTYVEVKGGSVVINAESNGIKAEDRIHVIGGDVNITCGSDGLDAPTVSGSLTINGQSVVY